MSIKTLFPILLCVTAGVFPLRSAPAPLPPLHMILENTLEHARSEELNKQQFDAHYAYERRKINEERTVSGTLTKHEDKISRHEPTQNLIPTANSTKPAPARNPKTVLDKKDFPLDEEMLSRFDFDLVGREVIEGRPAFILAFRPSLKAASPRNFKEDILNHAAGYLWVDEREFAVVKVNVELTSPISIVGGLAGSVRQLRYRFERARTPEGLWFVKSLTWHAEARKFLVVREMDYSEDTFDVRRVT